MTETKNPEAKKPASEPKQSKTGETKNPEAKKPASKPRQSKTGDVYLVNPSGTVHSVPRNLAAEIMDGRIVTVMVSGKRQRRRIVQPKPGYRLATQEEIDAYVVPGSIQSTKKRIAEPTIKSLADQLAE